VRLLKVPGICRAPQYVAEALLRAEGFTDIRHVERESSEEINAALAENHADFGTHYSADLLPAIEVGGAITILTGVHVGCQELFARDDIRSITDLKGRSVAVPLLTPTPEVLFRLWSLASDSTPPGTSAGSSASRPPQCSSLREAATLPARIMTGTEPSDDGTGISHL